jgi:CRISPR-associated protein Csb1
MIDGTPTTQHPDYIKARNSEPGNAWEALNTSVATVAFGGWDSSRRARQARYPSILTGEIMGVLADQESARPRAAQHSGARIDPVAMGLKLSPATINAIVEQQKLEYSDKFISKRNKKPSELGFGAIPPGTEDLAGIATRDIIRSHVLSFALLRRLRFGKGEEGDASLRVLIAALLLNAMARSDSELYLRANCHLVEAAQPEVRLDQRMGNSLALAPITIELADALLDQAYAAAVDKTGIEWNGLVLSVQGNPDIVAAADADEGE